VSTRAKHTCLLILAQTACVAVGLWMQHRHAASTLRSALEDHAWSRIEQRARAVGRELREAPIADLTAVDPAILAPQVAEKSDLPDALGVLVVDDRRQVLAQLSAAGHAEESYVRPGQRVAWTPWSEPAPATGGPTRGTLTLPDGPHIAVQHALAGGQGYVVVHVPATRLQSRYAGLAGSLSASGAIALCWTVAVLTIMVFVALGRMHEGADQQRAQAATDSLRQVQNLVRARDAVIFGLAKLAESRDDDTGEHLERISAYSTLLASALRRQPKYEGHVTPTFARLIGISAALHDIGKVGVRDEILLKPGRLTPEERAQMEAHARIGGDCLRDIEQRLGTSNFLQMAREIAFAHHERWDGTGYPLGLAGEAIPLAARIVAIADVYDALSSKRVYKPAFPHGQCIAIIRNQTGKHFDPDLVEVWLTIERKFREIAQRYRHSDAEQLPTIIDTPGSASPGADHDEAPGPTAVQPDVFVAVAADPAEPN
jgi:HD-GYP domain-containing protein (c-di-GMP phosphodiesterase class II)